MNLTQSDPQCNEATISEGLCYDLQICGHCYGENKVFSPEYEMYNLIIIGVLLPSIGLFGLLGNFLSAFTYSREEMRSSLNVSVPS
ncbi:hypothetical protein WR25_13455 [Diploscapter pachys]|uniref:G-protein coupled receptors family 1 profile domain-containing protein n=1 Tax=Diploscapter pachys TaxID=2018661 RepID=A0A2A2KGA3_9BILA|nr:hypothetical protein WR25_13455 [Diploscapter pachys]